MIRNIPRISQHSGSPSRLPAILALSVLVASTAALAQTPTFYVATQRPAPFVPIVGDSIPVLWDSAVTIPIGFEFTYANRIFTHVAIGENGAISLQASCNDGCLWDESCNFENICERSYIPGPWSGFPTPEPPNPILAAWWDDLIVDGNPPTSDVVAASLGTAPDRELVVEYRNMKKPTRSPSTRATFQIRLTESGEIRFHYGPSAPGPDQTEWSGYVGIEGLDGSTMIPGLTCSVNQVCAFSSLMTLANQVITFGVPAGPELVTSIAVPGGALPGAPILANVTVSNVGRGTPPASEIGVDLYLSYGEPLVVGRDALIGHAVFPNVEGQNEVTLTVTATIPGDVFPGYFLLASVVDPTRQIIEASEANNIGYSKPIPIGDDVSGYIIEAPPASPGDTVPVHLELFSASSELDVEWGLYLSYDDIFDAGDPALALSSDHIGQGETILVESLVTIPALPPSYVRYLLVVDPNHQIPEVEEVNNVGMSELFPTVSEFSVVYVEAPSTSGAGEPLVIRTALANAGPRASTAWTAHLSSDVTLDPSDQEIGRGTVSLEGREQLQVTLTTTVPEDVARLRPWFVLVALDPDQLIEEVDEYNNVAASAQPITLLGPDLGAPSVAGDSRAFRGSRYEVLGVIENLGAQTARGFQYRIFLSRNRLVTDADPLLFESEVRDLAPHERIEVLESVVIPDIDPGPYFLALVADGLNVVDEDRETNNVALLLPAIEILDPAPDFVTTELRIPVVAAAGESVTFARSLENLGNAPGQLEYLVRLRSALASASIVLGRDTVALDPGAADLGADTFVVPSGLTSGDYVVEYLLDPDSRVGEIDESNNVFASEGLLRLEADPLRFRTRRLPVGVVGQAYSALLEVAGASGAVTFSGESLPPGLSLEVSTGKISGQPSSEGDFRITIGASDGVRTIEAQLTILIVAVPRALELATSAVPSARVGQRYSYPLIATGGIPPLTFRSERLPRGFSLTSTGALVGTATAGGWSRSFAVVVTDDVGAEAERTLVLRSLRNDGGVRFRDFALPDAIAGESYRSELSAEGGRLPYSFAVPDLPPGLELMGAELVGEPSRAGTFVFAASVVDADGATEETLFVLRIQPPEAAVRILTTSLPAARVGVEYLDDDGRKLQIRAVPSAASSSVTIALATGALPAGLALSPDGTLSGTPTQEGVFAFVVSASDGSGSEAVRAFGIRVTSSQPDAPGVTDAGCDCSSNPSRNGATAIALAVVVLMLGLRRRSALTLLLLALAPVSVRAAPSPSHPYQVLEERRSFEPLTAGEALTFQGIDDAEVTVDLPFDFLYFDQAYSQLSIGTNGLVSFNPGEAANLNNESLLELGTPPNNLIGVFWDDMWDPHVSTEVRGAAPNRVFVVEWDDMQHYPGTPGEFFDMQLWLFEGAAGRFELHYGASTFFQSGGLSASAGFEDPSGTLGEALLACSPNCTDSDFVNQIGRVIVVTKDSGQDVRPSAFDLTTGPLGRVYVGGSFEAHVEFRSLTGAPLGPFHYGVQLTAPDGTLLDRLYSSTAVTVAPYSVFDEDVIVSIPASVAPGRYGVTLLGDVDEELDEPNESNNRLDADAQLVALAPRPNLVARAISFDAPVAPGSNVALSLTISNDGALDATAAYLVVLSSNETPSASDRAITGGSRTLSAGTDDQFTAQVTLPSDVPSGRFTFALLVDSDEAVAELDELDNAVSTEFFDVGSLSLAEARLPPAFSGVPYDVRIVVLGADESATFELAAGELPDGFRLDPSGRVSGVAVRPTLSSFSVSVERAGVTAVLGPIALEVFEGTDELVIVTRELGAGVAGQPYPIVDDPRERPVIETVGASAAVTFSSLSPLPRGLALDSDGYVHGVPEADGRYQLDVEVTDGRATARRVIPLLVVPSAKLTLVSGILPEAVVGERYSTRLSALGGPAGPPLFRGAFLPEGLSLGASGELNGTPTAIGTYRFRVEVERGQGDARQVDFGDLVLVVLPTRELNVTPSAVPTARIGAAYEVLFEAHLGVPPYVWRIEGGLPPGIESETVGLGSMERLRIFGTPIERDEKTGGLAAFLVEVTDALGQVARVPVAMEIEEAATTPDPTQSDTGSGCGCRTSSTSSSATGLTLVALLFLLLGRTRRPHGPSKVES